MNAITITRAAQAYGLPVRRVLEPQKGYRNESHKLLLTNGQTANLIVYKQEPRIIERIHAAHAVAAHLHQTGLPVRIAIDKRIMTFSSSHATQYGALYNYLPGETIPWEAYTMDHIKLVGMVMGKMHKSLQGFMPEEYLLVAAECRSLCDAMRSYFENADVQKALKTKLGLRCAPEICNMLRRVVDQADKLPEKCMLHMDFVRGNLLFASSSARVVKLKEGKVAMTGILDFEKTAYGNTVFDIARTLAFLLVDCKYKPADKIKKYFLYSGYYKRGEMPIPDYELLEGLTRLFLLHDFYKFLCHNPYEFLQQNEHFVRTRDLLTQEKVIGTT